jgi:predicted O-methyltransferase YrrM
VRPPRRLRELALDTKGFMPPEEGDALWAAALEAGRARPGLAFMEIGAYCGRSTLWLAAAARECGTMLWSLDHHAGSEEQQAGWEWHDAALVDPATGRMDSLPTYLTTLGRAGVRDVVVPLVGRSREVSARWHSPLALVFIDGGHGVESARDDWRGWGPRVARGGMLAIHDVYTDRREGGLAPHDEIYAPAVASGEYREIVAVGSLRVLQRAS